MGNINIAIEYLYRDAHNYKLWGEAIFTNSTRITLEAIRHELQEALIDGLFFIPEEWGFLRLSFGQYSKEADHDWHELDTESFISETDKLGGKDITALLKRLQATKQQA